MLCLHQPTDRATGDRRFERNAHQLHDLRRGFQLIGGVDLESGHFVVNVFLRDMAAIGLAPPEDLKLARCDDSRESLDRLQQGRLKKTDDVEDFDSLQVDDNLPATDQLPPLIRVPSLYKTMFLRGFPETA
jgi:hypothetical protein